MFKKALYSIGGGIFLIITAGIVYLFSAFPSVDEAPELLIESTTEQINRGKYLANNVAVCIDCHSERDWSRFSGPLMEDSYGKGGDVFDEKMGLPGTLYAKNITPANLGDWSDGEIYRLITTGVNKDGEPIFPLMPYKQYRYMDPEDVKAIIAYIRTLEPIDYEVPESELNFPVNLIVRTIPQNAEPTQRPEETDILEYGKYMVTIAACTACHTPEIQGNPIPELFMAGGFEFTLPGGVVRSSNITPHEQTGIGLWTEEQFVARFKSYDVPGDSLPAASTDGYNTIMPWKMYGGMKEQDLKAIYAYLRTLDPIEHQVIKFTPGKQLTAAD